MKFASLILIGSLLLDCAAPVLLHAGAGSLAVPSRSLAAPSPEEQKVIDFVLNTFEDIIQTGEKTNHFYYNQATDKLDEAVGVPPPHKFGDKHLATYYFKLDDKNAAARKIKAEHVLLWVHVAQGGKPAATTTAKTGEGQTGEGQTGDGQTAQTQTPKPSKKSTKDITFEFTNGVVSSKIKVQYGFGGMELLKAFIIRSCFNYLVKVEQSVLGLVSVEPLLTLFSTNIQDIYLGDKAAEFPFKLEAKQAASSLAIAYEGYKETPVPETLPGLKKVVDTTLEAMKKSKPDDKSKPEYLVYEVKPELTGQNPDEQPDYATYIDTFHLVILRAAGRVSIMAHSKHFTDSIEVSVNSKQAILDTVYSLCHKVILQTYSNFLDLEPKDDICPNGVVYLEKKGAAKLGLEVGNANPADTSGEGEGAAKVTHYKKDLGGRNWLAVAVQVIDNADVKVVVQLLKLSEDGATASGVIRRQNYFPFVSQYCMGVFMMSFIEKVKEDFADLAYSEAIRKPDLAKGEEDKNAIKQNLGLKFNQPFIPDIQFTAGNLVDLTSMRDAQAAAEECPEGINSSAPAAAAGKWQAQLCIFKGNTPRKVGVIMKVVTG